MMAKLTAFIVGVLAGSAIGFTAMSYRATVLEARAAETNYFAPESWGTVKGGSGQYVIFEDAAGTIRIYDTGRNSITSTVTRKKAMPR